MFGEVKVRVSNNMMEASIYVDQGVEIINEDYIMKKLLEHGVEIGINQLAIQEVVYKELKGLWTVVAEGKPAGETKPGYFEYFFDTNLGKSKTSIDERGYVHYGKSRAMVNKGDVIAKYHHSVSGVFGYTVLSTVIAPKPVRNFTIKTGKGVEIIDDCYYATVDGEVVLADGKLEVKDVLTIVGDAKFGIDSNTQFVGNVHVTGDVLTGVTIIANGSIEVDGCAEACRLVAGKDIIIHGGVKGNRAGRLEANGSVICTSIENATVIAKDTINADYVMNSELKAENSIIIHGKHGTIMGGTAVAVHEIIVDTVGNEAGIPTKLEIKNPNVRTDDLSKILVKIKAYSNTRLFINEVGYFQTIVSGKEYHLVNENIQTYDVGKYVSNKIFKEEIKTKKTILLVDDEAIILKTFFGILNSDYEVLLATSGKDAMMLLEKKEKVPDLMLLDFMMPNMDGAELLTKIRSDKTKPYRDVPVIFVTAVNDKQSIIKCLSLYPQGYLRKPIGKDDLKNAVDKYFETALDNQ